MVASFRIGSGNPRGLCPNSAHPKPLTRRDEPAKPPDLQVDQPDSRARHSDCHAEGRGFESLQPLVRKPSKSEGFLLREWREQEVMSPALPLGATKAWLSFVARDSTGGDARLWRGAGRLPRSARHPLFQARATLVHGTRCCSVRSKAGLWWVLSWLKTARGGGCEQQRWERQATCSRLATERSSSRGPCALSRGARECRI
jgi:hypothetical protein